jgi:hypothetical protein
VLSEEMKKYVKEQVNCTISRVRDVFFSHVAGRGGRIRVTRKRASAVTTTTSDTN